MTNTIVIWIFIPIGLSLLLAFLQKSAKWSTAITLLSSGILFLLAFVMPANLIIRLGSRVFVYTDSFQIFGRTLSITKANLSLIGGIYLCVFVWNLFARSLDTSHWFHSLSMLIAVMWVSTLAVVPFLYAAVIILLIAITSIPLLSTKADRASAGVLRYITFQSIAMPLILLSAWMLSGIETAPSANTLISRAAILVLSGFAIWFALFPVHSWVPMLAKESHPWTLSFLLVLMQNSLGIFFIYFLEEYSWLRNLPNLWDILCWAGISTIVAASVLISFQKNIYRLLAYLYLWEMGYSLLAIGMAQYGGLHYLQLIFLPRMLGYSGLSYNLAKLGQLEPDLDGDLFALRGFYHRYPALSIGIITSLLSLAGLPLLASYPAKRHLLNLLPWSGYGMETWLAIGFVGILIVIFRVIHQLVSPPDPNKTLILLGSSQENIATIVFNAFLILFLFLCGLFPGVFSGLFEGILLPFSKIFILN